MDDLLHGSFDYTVKSPHPFENRERWGILAPELVGKHKADGPEAVRFS
jgi:hypothetical protein